MGFDAVCVLFNEKKSLVTVENHDPPVYNDYYDAVRKKLNIEQQFQFVDEANGCAIDKEVFISYKNKFANNLVLSLDFIEDEHEKDIIQVDDINFEDPLTVSLIQGALERPIIVTEDDGKQFEINFCAVPEAVPSFRKVLSIATIQSNPDPVYQVLLKTKVLANKDRITFAKSLIKYILENDQNRKLTREDFHLLSSIISNKIFPGDLQGAWFTPAQNCKVAKGKLYNAYVNLRTTLFQKKIIERRPRNTKTNVEIEINSKPIEADAEDRIRFLESNVLPFNELINAWKVTHLTRMKILKESNISTGEYLNKFPILSESNGHEVISLDFNLLFPEAVTNIVEAWDFYYPLIIKVSKESRNVEIKTLLKLITGSKAEDEITAFFLLPYLLPSTITKKKTGGKKQKLSKASKVEVQKSFIVSFKNLTEAQLDEKKRFEKNLVEKTSLQPRVTIIGETLIGPNSVFYVNVVDKKFYFDTCLETVSFCFKLYHSLNLEYPLESNHVFYLLEKYVFKIEANSNISVDSFMHDLIR